MFPSTKSTSSACAKANHGAAQFALTEPKPLQLPNFGCQISTSNSGLGSTRGKKSNLFCAAAACCAHAKGEGQTAQTVEDVILFYYGSHEPKLTLCVPNRSFIRLVLSEWFEQALEVL